MSSIGGVSRGSAAWAQQVSSARAQPARESVFEALDGDQGGAVDGTELQAAIDAIAKQSGREAGDVSQLMSTLDGNGDGSLDAAELDAGLRDLMPPPSSTVDFAQRTGGQEDDLFAKVDADGDGGVTEDEMGALLQAMDEGRGQVSDSDKAAAFAQLDSDGDGSLTKAEFAAGKPQGAGGPPPAGPRGAPPAGGGKTSDTSSTSSSTSTNPLDTDGDGTVSAQERVAGELKALSARLSELAQQLQTEYGQISGTSTAKTTGGTVDITA